MPAPKRFRLQNRCWILIIINKKYKGDENDCMNMEFYRGLYVSPSLKLGKEVEEAVGKREVLARSVSDRTGAGQTKSIGVFLYHTVKAACF